MTIVTLMVIGTDLRIEGSLGTVGIGAEVDVYFETKGGVAPHLTTEVLNLLPGDYAVTEEGDGRVRVVGTAVTPSGDSPFTLTLRGFDADQEAVDQTFSLRVIPLPLEVSGSLAAATVGTPYSDTITIAGGVAPYSVISATLPDGFGDSLSTDTITVDGTLTGAGLGPGYAKTFPVSITVEDAIGSTITFNQVLSITVPTLVVAGTAPTGTTGAAYSYSFGSTGGASGSKTFASSVTPPVPGLTLSAAGLLSGTPTTHTGSPFAFTVTVTDSEGNVSSGSAQSVAIAESDPSFASVSALLHFDGNFTDVIGNTWTTAANSQTSATFAKFGSASMLHGVTNYHIHTASNARFGFGSGDYTVEGWYRNPGVTGDRCLFDTRTGANAGIAIYVSTSGGGNAGKLAVYSNAALLARASTGFTTGTWQHWAVVRDGTTVYGYLDGVMVLSVTDSRTLASASTCFFGDNYLAPSQPTQGNSDDFRVTKGVCRYPGGTTFTPRTAPFPNS